MVSSSEPVLGRSWVPHWHGRFPPQPRDCTVAAWSSCRIPESVAKRVANSPPVVGDLVWRVAREGHPVNRKENLLFSIYSSDHSIKRMILTAADDVPVAISAVDGGKVAEVTSCQ